MKKILNVMFMLFFLTAANAQIKVINSIEDLRESYKDMLETGKRLVIYIPDLSGIDRCDECIEIESKLFKNPEFLSMVENKFSLIILDMTKVPELYSTAVPVFHLDYYNRFLFIDKVENGSFAITYVNRFGPMGLADFKTAINSANENKKWLNNIYNTEEFDISSFDEIDSIVKKAREIYAKNGQSVSSHLARRLPPETYLKEGFAQHVVMEPDNTDQKYFQFLLNNPDRILDAHGEQVLNAFKYTVYTTFAEKSIEDMDGELFMKVKNKLLPDVIMTDEEMEGQLYHLDRIYYTKKGDSDKVLEQFNDRYGTSSLNPRSEIENFWIHHTDKLDVTLYDSILEKYQKYQPSEGEYLTYFMVLSKLYEVTGNKITSEAISNGYIQFLEENKSKESFDFYEEVGNLEELTYITTAFRKQLIDFVLSNESLEMNFSYHGFLRQNYEAIGDEVNAEKQRVLLVEKIKKASLQRDKEFREKLRSN